MLLEHLLTFRLQLPGIHELLVMFPASGAPADSPVFGAGPTRHESGGQGVPEVAGRSRATKAESEGKR